MDPHRMEKVDLIPLEWVVLTDRPSFYNGGIMMWCRRCGQPIGEDVAKDERSGLAELVKIADVHQRFYCPCPDGAPDWSWSHRETSAYQAMLRRRSDELEIMVLERVNEALSAAKLPSRSRR